MFSFNHQLNIRSRSFDICINLMKMKTVNWSTVFNFFRNKLSTFPEKKKKIHFFSGGEKKLKFRKEVVDFFQKDNENVLEMFSVNDLSTIKSLTDLLYWSLTLKQFTTFQKRFLPKKKFVDFFQKKRLSSFSRNTMRMLWIVLV